MNPHVTVLGTGGTIACTTDAAGDLVPTCSISTLLSHAGIAPEAVTARDVMQLDSSTMTLADLDALLVDIHSADGPVVLTHGTDSMEETAMAVDRLLGGPVVLTGAQRPADDASPEGPDGPRNLCDAVAAAATAESPVVALGGKVVPAYGVTKVHTTADEAFGSVGEPRPERLSSGAALSAGPAPLAGLRVDVVPAYQGAEASLVDTAVAAGADGIVVAAFGSGNVGVLSDGVRRALDAGIPVVVASRVPAGGVQLVYGGAGGGRAIARAGVRSAGKLSVPQARMELLCELAVRRAQQDRAQKA